MSKENYLEYSPDVIIAALNEEKGIGPTLTEISKEISPNKVIYLQRQAPIVQAPPTLWRVSVKQDANDL